MYFKILNPKGPQLYTVLVLHIYCICIIYLGLYRYLVFHQPLKKIKCFRALYCINVVYIQHILGIYLFLTINFVANILVVKGLVTIYSKHIPPLNCTVILIGTTVLVVDMAAVLQLYQQKTQILCICGIYAQLGHKDLAAHLYAIYCNIAAIFVISIYYI